MSCPSSLFRDELLHGLMITDACADPNCSLKVYQHPNRPIQNDFQVGDRKQQFGLQAGKFLSSQYFVIVLYCFLLICFLSAV